MVDCRLNPSDPSRANLPWQNTAMIRGRLHIHCHHQAQDDCMVHRNAIKRHERLFSFRKYVAKHGDAILVLRTVFIDLFVLGLVCWFSSKRVEKVKSMTTDGCVPALVFATGATGSRAVECPPLQSGNGHRTHVLASVAHAKNDRRPQPPPPTDQHPSPKQFL